MMESDLISIIVPVYNGHKYLKNCLNSILNNSYKNIELIVVNDGSTDESDVICQEFVNKHSRVKHYSKKNGGIVSARNFGLEKANGKYICFSDQDDEVPVNSYELLYENILKYQAQMCIGSYQILYERKKIDCFSLKNEGVYSTKEEIINNLIIPTIENVNRTIDNRNYKNVRWNIWNCMYERQYLKKFNIKFFKYIDYEDDLLFNLEVYKNIEKISYTNMIVYYWRKNLKSTSNSKRYIENYWVKASKLKEYYLTVLTKCQLIDKNYRYFISRINERLFLDYLYNECNNNCKNSLNITNLVKAYNSNFSELSIEKLKNLDFRYDIINTNDFFTRKFLNKKYVKLAYYFNKYIYNMIFRKIIYIYRSIKLIGGK